MNFLKLIRFPNLLILALTQYFTRIFLIGPSSDFLMLMKEEDIFFICICTMLIAAGGYIINDYYDIKIDMINKPDRVVLGKHISRRMGLFLHGSFTFLGISMAYFKLSLNVAIFIACCSFLLWIYSNFLKRTAFWGNLTISVLAFASLFIIGLYYRTHMDYILFFGFFAFASMLIREIVKDMEDVKGDALFDCKTLPIVYGIKATKSFIYVIATVIVCVIVLTLVFVNKYLYGYLLVFTALPFIFLVYKLYFADKQSDFQAISAYAKIIMVLGIVGMILL